jgi:hypothetical protein
MSVVETYRVVNGTTRALLHFERSEEVCECVAEMILERRFQAGVQSPPAALRKIALALRDGVRFVEDERGLIVPEGMRGSEMARGQAAKGPPGTRRPPKKRRTPKKRPR